MFFNLSLTLTFSICLHFTLLFAALLFFFFFCFFSSWSSSSFGRFREKERKTKNYLIICHHRTCCSLSLFFISLFTLSSRLLLLLLLFSPHSITHSLPSLSTDIYVSTKLSNTKKNKTWGKIKTCHGRQNNIFAFNVFVSV